MQEIKLNYNKVKKLNLLAVLLLTVSALINPLTSFGQNIKANKEAHHETTSDSYLPNAHNNKRTSPAYKYTIAKKGINSSTIITTQVNVNGSGENILGDAANETSIAVH